MNGFNQLGTSLIGSGRKPQIVVGTGVVSRIANGPDFACALRTNGDVLCWGSGERGELGIGRRAAFQMPQPVALASAASDLAAGHSHACAVVAGLLACWGANDGGQLGVIVQGGAGFTPVAVTGLVSVTQVAAGRDTTCAIAASNLRCWGRNSHGQLGATMPVTEAAQIMPTLVTGLGGPPRQVTMGELHTCVLNDAGAVYCFGANGYGQLGAGDTVTNALPREVKLPGAAKSISAGYFHTCALLTAGATYCWGRNSSEQLGIPPQAGSSPVPYMPMPTLVGGLGSTEVRAISAGGSHTCALMSSGGVQCWGANYWGQLGDGMIAQRHTPAPVLGLTSGASALSTGAAYGCAALATGGMRCWGHNVAGQLGSNTAWRASPVSVAYGDASARLLLPLTSSDALGEGEPNNSVATAKPIASGLPLRGVVSDVRDVFVFTTTVRTTLDARLVGLPLAANGVLQLQLFERDAPSADAVRYVFTAPYVVTATLPAGKAYTIVVFTPEPVSPAVANSEYRLTVTY
jgi:alpha-tubulin suppressor-like RCC1 family protein